MDDAMSAPVAPAEETKALSAGEAKLADAEELKEGEHIPLLQAVPLTRAITASPAALAGKEPGKAGVECFSEFKDGFHERLGKHWPQPKGQLHAGGVSKTSEFTRRIMDKLRAGVAVLDLCCGEGATMIQLARDFPLSRFTGIDIVPRAIENANAAAAGMENVTFVTGTIFELPFVDEEFDVVLAQDPDGFSNKDRAVAFKEAARVLKPGGLFFLHHHWIPGRHWTMKQLLEYEQFHKSKGWMASAFSAQNYIDDATAAGFALDEVTDQTELAREHFQATAELMRRAEGRVFDDWLAMNLTFLEEGRDFGVQIFAHKDTIMELVNLGRYDEIKEYMSGRTNEQLLAVRDVYDWTVFHHAAKDGQLDFVKWLVEERKVPVDIRDGNGSFPVYRAIGFGRKEVREYLMTHGTDLTHINDHGDNALHNSTDTGDEPFSHYLIDEGLCDPFLKDTFHYSSVAYALPNMPNWVGKVFDQRISEVKRFVRWRLRRYDFDGLDEHLNEDEEDMEGVESIIQQIVNRESDTLLQHPLIFAYFNLRWIAFARRQSLWDLAEHIMDLSILVAFAVTLQYQGGGLDDEIRTIVLALLLLAVSLKNLYKELQQYLEAKNVKRRVLGRAFDVSKYWLDFWNIAEIVQGVLGSVVPTAVLIGVAVDGLGGAAFASANWVSDILMIVILLFFFRTLKFLSLFKTAGPYIRTILRMVSDLAIFLSFFLVFWVGFSLSWFVKFREETVGSIWNVHRSVLETLVVGDAGDIRDAIETAGVVAQIVFVLMLLLLPLLLVNLLIAMMNTTYSLVQYKAKAEYYLLWARYILEVENSIPKAKLRKLLRDASIASFHSVAGENNTSIDTVAMARAFEFRHDSTWVWSDRNAADEAEDTQSLLFLREDLVHALARMENRLTNMIKEETGAQVENEDEQEVERLLRNRMSADM